MIASEIFELFKKHVDRVVSLGVQSIKPGKSVAMIFGTDEVQVDLVNLLITMPVLGQVPFDPISIDFTPEWFTLYTQDNERWSVLMGTGDPFDDAHVTDLPSINGVVMAAPAMLNPDAFKKQE